MNEQEVAQKVGLFLGIFLGTGTAILLLLLVNRFRKTAPAFPPGIRALFEVGILFLPAIPAYLWVWPNVQGTAADIFQTLTYFYVLVGTLFIGLRRFSWDQLGVNTNGLIPGLLYGALLIAGRSLVILSVDWQAATPARTAASILTSLAFYTLVSITEELLFRGLVYRALLDWRGVRWAIWGSSFGFMLWHIFGQGPFVGAAMLLYGLVFGLMRWRAGGILALVITHTLVDFFGILMLPDVNLVGLGKPEIPHPAWLLLGLGIIVGIPLFLWLGHGRISQFRNRII